MNKRAQTVKGNLWLVMTVAAVIILVLSLFPSGGPDITSSAGRKLEKKLSARTARLEGYMKQVLACPKDEWPDLDDFPSDMVIYRYIGDTLKSWNNQFSLDNDDIGNKVFIQRFSNLRYNTISPLVYADTALSYMNMGPKWYLVKSMDNEGGCRVIGGLMVKNTSDGTTLNGVSRKLGLSDRFGVYPIAYSGGAAVSVEGIPLLKVVQENANVMPLLADPWTEWPAFFLIICAIFLFLFKKCTLGRMFLSWGVATAVCAVFFAAGYGMRGASDIFSPSIYADDGLFYSLGALLILNTWIFSLANCLFISRKAWLRFIEAKNTRRRMTVFTALIIAALIATAVYIHLSLRSLIANSNINLALYNMVDIDRNTVYVYLSYLFLLLGAGQILHMLSPAVRRRTSLRYNIFSRTGRLCLSVAGAVYLLAMTSVFGLRREESRTEIWANRLAMDRNLSFEIRLRTVEQAIAGDVMIPALLPVDKNFSVIISRIKENYLSALSGDYDINLYMFRDTDPDAVVLRYFSDRISGGTPLADNSRFFYTRSSVGMSQYTGVFTFFNESVGVVRLIIDIESKKEYEGTGYEAIINGGNSGTLGLPPDYSYAKYLDDKLISYRGEYPYPIGFTERFREAGQKEGMSYVTINKFIHFVNQVTDSEYVVISRRSVGALKYLVALTMIALMAYFVCCIPTIGGRRKKQFEKNYYKQRINTVLLVSLMATLVSMASISVLFIYRRNNANMNELMVRKINTVQSLVQDESRRFSSVADFATNEFRSSLDNIGRYTNSGITLYTTGGKVLMSTFPEIFERLTIGTRLDGDSYRDIVYMGRRYYIDKARIRGRSVYTMSAPVFGADGSMLAIVSTPYTDSGLSFRDDALFHAGFVITVFFILLLLTRFVTAKVVDKMFRPLIDMGHKMKLAKTSGLQYIIYDRDDEIATVVDSYNRMVHDLSESGKQAAQLERDKAWSEMARQVAHEIKNPLTPIKLQIQRIIRLKSKNDPSWQEKFDGIISVVMDSIDQLTDTANEFSTFAKLYGEKPVEIDLDRLASDEITLFSGKDNITFEYIGLKDAVVTGPKPQLTRVFVNLLTNSVQAIEGRQKEEREAGQEPAPGHINLSIRNSVKDGFYDIVFEDDGPGVKDENRSRLFTPNFTTKSSGTGLGLAICKNILDRCGGEISYSRSFALGGACFTVRYPKN